MIKITLSLVLLIAMSLLAINTLTPAFASPYALQSGPSNPNANVTSGNTNPSSTGAITVTTDKSSYNQGDTIIISGTTQEYISGTPIRVSILNPIGNLVIVNQVDLGSDRTYSTSVTATGALWQAAGMYTVRVQFGSPDRTAQTTFQFSGTQVQPNPTILISPGSGSSANAYCVTTKSCFSPNPLYVAPSTTVTWINNDQLSHTVTSGKVTDNNAGSLFDSGLIKSGNTFQFTFSTAGTYDYMCTVHPWMTGQVIVGGASSTPNPILTVRTDLPSYNHGDTIVITGHIDNMQGSSAVTLRIFNAHQNLLSVSQIVPSYDGSFTKTILVTGPLWEDAGTYSLVAQYGSAMQPITTSFQINASQGGTENPPTSGHNPYLPCPDCSATTRITIVPGAGTSASADCVSTKTCFTPNPAYTGSGGTITWKNADSLSHTITSGKVSDSNAGSLFDSGLIKSGNTFQFTFPTAGTYDYFCTVHPWMLGQVVVEAGLIPPPSPTPQPSPTTTTLSVVNDKSYYNQGDVVTTTATLSGVSSGQNIAVSVTDPSGNSMISRVLSTNDQGSSILQFKIPETSPIGTYQVVVTSSVGGNTLKQTTQFIVDSQYAVSIGSVQSTDQQGNPITSFTRGGIGYVKVVLLGQSNQNGLITINLFDSDSASLGIGSLKGTIATGQSEIVLSFSIPKDAVMGTANIYADVFSDYPSKGGTPLTKEISNTVEIK